MSARLGRLGKRHPDRVLAGLALLAGACGFALGEGQDRLELGGGERPPALVVRVSGPLPLKAPAAGVALEVMRSQLRADPAVASVAQGPVGRGTRRVLLRVRFADGAGTEADVERVRSRLDPGILTVAFAGGAGMLRDVRDETLSDLLLLLLAAPLAALLGVAVLGSRHALAALFAGAAAVLGAGAAAVGLSLLTDVSVLAPIGAACAGIPVAVLLCGIGPGRAATAAALAAAAVFAAAALLGVEYLAWFGAGGALASLLAIAAAAAAVPAATELWAPPERRPGIAARGLGRLDAVLAARRLPAALAGVLALAAAVTLAVQARGLDPAALGGPAPPLGTAESALAAAAALLAVAAAALLAGRRLGPAAAAALGAGLSAAAGAGVGFTAFENGGLDGILDMRTSQVSLGALVAGAATVAAVSASQSTARIAAARGPTAGPVTVEDAGSLAALTAVLAAASLTLSSQEFAYQYGVMAAAGIVIDALLVRGLLRGALAAVLPGAAPRSATGNLGRVPAR